MRIKGYLLLSDLSCTQSAERRVVTKESSSFSSCFLERQNVPHLVLTPLKLELETELRLDRPLSLAELASTGEVCMGESEPSSSLNAESGLSGSELLILTLALFLAALFRNERRECSICEQSKAKHTGRVITEYLLRLFSLEKKKATHLHIMTSTSTIYIKEVGSLIIHYVMDWFADLLHVQRILLLLMFYHTGAIMGLHVKVPVQLLRAAGSTEPLVIMDLGVGGGDDRGDGRRFPHAAQRAAEGRSGGGTDEGGTERSGGVSARELVPWKEPTVRR